MMTCGAFPVDENGKLILEQATLEDLEAAFQLRRRAEAELNLLEDPEGAIEQIETNIGVEDRAWVNTKKYYEDRIKHMNDLMKDPRCSSNKSVLAIVHNIEILYANLEACEADHLKNREDLQKELTELQDKKKACKAVLPHVLAQLRVYAANKFHIDISKGFPHPVAFHDPLYHDRENRYVADASKLKWEEGWENGNSDYEEDSPDGRIV